jgi:HEAT repeat protein
LSSKTAESSAQVEILLVQLRDVNNVRGRIDAMTKLSELRDLRALQPLIEAIDDNDEYIRAYAALSLGILGDPRAGVSLTKLLKDKHHFVRFRTAEALGLIGDTCCVNELIIALKDENYEVRWEAAKALGYLRDDRAIEPLMKLLDDDNLGVKMVAIRSLGRFRNQIVLEFLVECLLNECAEIRFSSAFALGEIMDSKSTQPLIKALTDNNSEVRAAAAIAIGCILDPSGFQPIIKLLKQSDDLVSSPLIMLKNPNINLTDLFINLLSHENAIIRQCLTLVLPSIACPNRELIYNALFEKLKDDNYTVRATAAKALGEIGDVSFADVLIKALQDEDYYCILCVKSSIRKIVDKIDPELALSIPHGKNLCTYSEGSIGQLLDMNLLEIYLMALRKENYFKETGTAKFFSRLRDTKTELHAIEKLCFALSDYDPQVQYEAAKLLGKIGSKDAVEPLIKTLITKDGFSGVAAEALGMICDARAIEPLIQALSYINTANTIGVDYSLGTALIKLIKALQNENRNIKCESAKILGRIKDIRSVEPLILALRSNDNELRRAAAEGLGGFVDSRPVMQLISLLEDEDQRVRRTCMITLGEIGDSRAIEPIIEIMRNKIENEDLKLAATCALGCFKGDKIVSNLIFASKENSAAIRAAALNSLGQTMDARAIDRLVEAALKDPEPAVRIEAVCNLGRFHDDKALKALIQALEDRKPDVRMWAAGSLGNIENKAAINPLKRLLKDPSSKVQYFAEQSIAKLRKEQ